MRARDARKRQAKGWPWFRSHDKHWYVTVKGVRYKLVSGDENKEDNNHEEAVKEWHRLMALAHIEDNKDANFVWVIFEKYLENVLKNHPDCYRVHRRYCQSFKDRHPELRVAELTVGHVEDWLDSHPTWNSSTCSNAIAIILAALNFAANPKRRYIKANPIRGMSRPPIRSRGAETVIDPDTFQKLYNASPPWLQDALLALRQTGTRPCNLVRMTAETIDAPNRCVRLSEHKTARTTQRPLIIPLTEPALRLLLWLAEKHPEGPIFRDHRGKPATSRIIRNAFFIVKKKLGMEDKAILYGLRHTLATELLSKDVPDAKVAFVLGHRSTAMLAHHYSHLDATSKSIAEEIDRVINGSAVKSNAASPEAQSS